MRLTFLTLSSDERRLYIEQAAARRNMPPVMLEKDFWVCWALAVLFESSFGDAIVFKLRYPTTQPAGFGYLKRAVKLEFGSLTEQRPTGRHPVRPWIADVLEEPFNDWNCNVVALDVHRTFWEKATILHSEYHRPPDRPTPDACT